MGTLAVIAPVLGRPHRAQPLADSLATAAALETRLVFVCSPDDNAQREACLATGADVLIADWQPGNGDWARKINYGYRMTSEPYMLLAADDIHFHADFDIRMLVAAEHGKGVVGCKDLGNPTVDRGLHACHPLVARTYADTQGTVDEIGVIVHEGYRHNFCDTELVETARCRGQWTFVREAVIEHRHPFWGKAADDATYELGRAGYAHDRRLFQQRKRLWTQAKVA